MTKPKHKSQKKKLIIISAGGATTAIIILSLLFFLPGHAGPDPKTWYNIPDGDAAFFLYVQDSGGNGLVGAEVYVSGGVFGTGRAIGQTGAKGYFNAINFPEGTYTFWATHGILSQRTSNQTVTLTPFSEYFVGVLKTP